MSNEEVRQFQDLGELSQKIRLLDGVGPSGVEPLYPNDGESHTEALEGIREIVDEHYGESVERLADDGQEVVIERLVVPSDDVPHIEYTLVDEV